MTEYSPDLFVLYGSAIIAPFWANVDTTGTGTVYYRETTSSALLTRATTEIRSVFPNGFTATNLFIATWDHVGYYSRHTNLVGSTVHFKVSNN